MSLGAAIGLGVVAQPAKAAPIYITGTGVDVVSGLYNNPRIGSEVVGLDQNWKVIAFPTTQRNTNGQCWSRPQSPNDTNLPCVLYNAQPANSITVDPASTGYAPVTRPATGFTTAWGNSLIQAWGNTTGKSCINAAGNAATCYWALPNRDPAGTSASGITYPSTQNMNMRSFYGPFCPSSDAFNAVCYNWILQKEFAVSQSGYYSFSMEAGADNEAKVWLDGNVVARNGVTFATTPGFTYNNVADIDGGVLLGSRPQTGDGATTAYNVALLAGGPSRVYLTAGTHKISIVISDGWSGTGAFVGTTSFELVPGPLPVLGAGAAFGWSRRLRRRIAVSRRDRVKTQSA